MHKCTEHNLKSALTCRKGRLKLKITLKFFKSELIWNKNSIFLKRWPCYQNLRDGSLGLKQFILLTFELIIFSIH
jgi:hypothetical protein